MKTITTVFLLALLFPSLAWGGKIYGIIKEKGKPVRQGIEVKITTASDSTVVSGQTDKNGLYRLYVEGTGKYNLTVRDTLLHKGDTLSMGVRSYLKSVRYNLVIQKDKQGKHILKRE